MQWRVECCVGVWSLCVICTSAWQVDDRLGVQYGFQLCTPRRKHRHLTQADAACRHHWKPLCHHMYGCLRLLHCMRWYATHAGRGLPKAALYSNIHRSIIHKGRTHTQVEHKSSMRVANLTHGWHTQVCGSWTGSGACTPAHGHPPLAHAPWS